MTRLFVAIIVATLLIVFATAGGQKKAIKKRAGGIQITSNANVFQWICQVSGNGYTFCTANTATSTKSTLPTTTTTTEGRGQPGGVTPSTTRPSTTTESSSTEKPLTTSAGPLTSSTSSSTPSALELAHWCQYAANGSWLPFNYTFMHLPCVMCHCAADHDIVCNELQCMDLHCIDGTVPKKITGQCCPQCAYETVSTSCRMNGLTFPHGTRVTTVESDVECWCQSGSIECRKIATAATTAASSTTTVKPAPALLVYASENSSLPSGMTAYVVIIVICLVLMLGTLLCCGCALAYYYYYQNQQQNMQQAYEQYYNNAGWQPMGADGVTAEDKQAEAAQQADAAANYPIGQSPQYIPPPYAVYSGPYEPKPQGQQQV